MYWVHLFYLALSVHRCTCMVNCSYYMYTAGGSSSGAESANTGGANPSEKEPDVPLDPLAEETRQLQGEFISVIEQTVWVEISTP